MAGKKIESLTDEQRALISVCAAEWTAIGLCTDPADRTMAEAGIVQAYQAAKLNPPEQIVWCSSPLSAALTRAILLTNKKADVRDSVRASVRDIAWDSVWDSVRDSVGDIVWDIVWDIVRASVGDSVRDSVGDSVRDSVRDSARASVWQVCYGQHDAAWLAFYDFFRQIGLRTETVPLTGLWAISRSAGWWWPHERIVWITERHNTLNRDAQGRLHAEHGLACGYPDGWGVYAWHGVMVPADLILHPGQITIDHIRSEANAEIRRIMLERYGFGRYLLDSGAAVLHADETGTLYRTELANDEPLVMVSVLNSTHEPDGSQKPYLLRVPPDMTQARQAVAWTFAQSADDYRPMIET